MNGFGSTHYCYIIMIIADTVMGLMSVMKQLARFLGKTRFSHLRATGNKAEINLNLKGSVPSHYPASNMNRIL